MTNRKPSPDDESFRCRVPAGHSPDVIHDVSELATNCSLPGTLLRVLQETSDENSSKGSLARVIGGDPDLTERVLRAANSPLYLTYGDRTKSGTKVTNLPTSILRLGFARVRNIALTQGLCAMARGGHELGVGIVVHLIVVAELARGLGSRFGRERGEDAGLAGLMHDFGKLALLRTLPLDYMRISARCQARKCSTLAAEEELLAPAQPNLRNHLHVGVELLKSHRIPQSVIDAVSRHHMDPIDWDDAMEVGGTPWLVVAANQLAYSTGFGDGVGKFGIEQLPMQDIVDATGGDHATLSDLMCRAMEVTADAIEAARLPVKPGLLRAIDTLRSGGLQEIKGEDGPATEGTGTA